MMMAGIVSVASIALPAVAGCVLIPVVIEAGEKYAYGVFFLVAVLSFFITADRQAMLIYVLFFGYYPVLYSTLGKIKSKVLSYIVKLLIFNLSMIADYLIVVFIFGIPIESIEIFGDYGLVALLLLANVAFVLYNSTLEGLGSLYYVRLHPMAKKYLLRK